MSVRVNATQVLKPAGMTFETAAAIPQAGVIALQGIREKGQVQAGQKVLIMAAGAAPVRLPCSSPNYPGPK